MSGGELLLLGALSAGSVAGLLAWSRHLPKAPQVALAGFAGAALLVAVLDVHFAGRARGDLQEWVAVVAVAMAVIGGGPATVAVFTLVDRARSVPTAAAASPRSAVDDRVRQGAYDEVGDGLRGGAWIGALERLAIVSTLVAGWPEGMAVVLAVKAFGRYPELRAANQQGPAEAFIIGTLVSVLWAVACAFVITGGIPTGRVLIAP